MNRPDLAPGETAVAMGPPALGAGPSRGNDIGHPADVPKAASQSRLTHYAIQTHVRRFRPGAAPSSSRRWASGLAVALFLDATLIRLVILPSTLNLLGQRSWYLPRWLDWLPHLQAEPPQAPSSDEPVAVARRL